MTAPASFWKSSSWLLENRRVARAAVVVAWALAALHFGPLIASDEYRPAYRHYDEPNWIWIGVKTWERVRAGDWSDPFWREEFMGWGSPNPQLGKIFIGAPTAYYLNQNPDLGLHDFGNYNSTLLPEVWPDFRLYYPARLQAALFTMLAALLIFDLARRLFHPLVGLAALWGFIHHPYVEASSFQAMTDACALFGMTLAFWGLFRARPLPAALAAGIGFGWAMATRLNSLALLPALLFALVWRSREHGSRRLALAQAALVILIAVGIFYAVNPYLWQEPLAGLGTIFGHSPGKGFLFTGDLRTLFEVLRGLFLQGAAPDATVAPALRPWPYLILAAYGMASLRQTQCNRRQLLPALAVALWLTLAIAVPRDWGRYYLIGIVPMAILYGYGMVTAVSLLWPWLGRAVERGRELERSLHH